MIKLPLRTARFNSPLSDDNVRISCWFSSHRVLTCLLTPLWTLQGCKPSWGTFFECVCSSHLSPNCCCLNIISLSSSRTESMLSYGSMEENKFIMQDFFSSRAKWVFVYPYTIQLPPSWVNNCGLLIIVLIVSISTKIPEIPAILSQCVVSCWLFMLLSSKSMDRWFSNASYMPKSKTKLIAFFKN